MCIRDRNCTFLWYECGHFRYCRNWSYFVGRQSGDVYKRQQLAVAKPPSAAFVGGQMGAFGTAFHKIVQTNPIVHTAFSLSLIHISILWMNLTRNVAKKPGGRIGAGEVISFLVLLAIGVGLPLLQGSEGADVYKRQT